MDNLCKVLIVEDEYIIRQGIRSMIDWNAEGFDIVGEANNGQDALELVKTLNPHIVITDIVMPIMDGLELEKKLRENYPDTQMIVLSSYSDFDYVRNSFQNGAVDYILKPTLNPINLLDTMKKVVARIPGLTLRSRRELSIAACIEQMLNGFLSEKAEIQLKNVFREPCFLLVGMNASHVFGQDLASIEKMKKLLTLSIEEKMPQYNHVQLVVNRANGSNGSVILLVINFQECERKSVFHALYATAEQIARQEPCAFFVTSPVFSNVQQLKAQYNSGFLTNLDRSFYYKGRHFVTDEEFQQPQPPRKFNKSDFTKLLETFQVENALDYLEKYVHSALREWNMDEMELKSLVQNSWYQIISALEDQGLNADSLSYMKRDCLVKLYACSYAEDFLQTFSVLQADLRSIIQKYEVDSRSTTIENILKFIDGQYSEPLTLASLAHQFNFNYTYLSSYFRTHHKEGFSEYLNKVRIGHATELLRLETLSISDVCEMVGYTDQSYFTRVFKKATGKTPREYRKQYSLPGSKEL